MNDAAPPEPAPAPAPADATTEVQTSKVIAYVPVRAVGMQVSKHMMYAIVTELGRPNVFVST